MTSLHLSRPRPTVVRLHITAPQPPGRRSTCSRRWSCGTGPGARRASQGRAGREREVKPAPFAYHAPATVDEAVDLLARHDGARVLAGGQSLVPLMKLRLAKPSALVDVNGVAGLDGVREDGGGAASSARSCASSRCSTTPARRASAPLVGPGDALRRLPRDAPPRHRRRLAGLRRAVGGAARRVRRARRDDRGALRAREPHRSPRASSSATRTPPRSSRTSC